MSEIVPVVRYLILCEDVQSEAVEPQRVTLIGLMSSIHSMDDPPFPLLHHEFCAFLQLTSCRGPAHGHIEIRYADSDEVIYCTQKRLIAFVSDPLEVMGVNFRLRGCLFPRAGLYSVQFWYNDIKLAEQPLLLR